MGALETDSFKNQINEVKLLWTEHIEKCKKFSISIIDNDLNFYSEKVTKTIEGHHQWDLYSFADHEDNIAAFGRYEQKTHTASVEFCCDYVKEKDLGVYRKENIKKQIIKILDIEYDNPIIPQ